MPPDASLPGAPLFDPDRDMVLFDLAQARRGWALNRLAHRLRLPDQRTLLRADPDAYLAGAGLSAAEHAAVQRRDWGWLLRGGASIYALAKLGSALNTTLPEIMAATRDLGHAERERP